MSYTQPEEQVADLPKIKIAKLYKIRDKILKAIIKKLGVQADVTTVADITQSLRPVFKSKANYADDGFAVLTPVRERDDH